MPRRPDDFDLRAALRAANFTPRTQDTPALIALLLDSDEAAREDAARAMGSMDAAAAQILARAAEATPPLRGRLCRVVGRLAQRGAEGARGFLLARLQDEDERTRSAAAQALGHLPGLDVEEALLHAWRQEQGPAQRRALAAALGKVGGAGALAALRALRSDDPELRRVAERAALMLDRTEARQQPAPQLRLDRAARRALPLLARCRPGLEPILAEELRARLGLEARPAGTGALALELPAGAPPLALLQARTLLQLALPLPAQPVVASPDDRHGAAAGARPRHGAGASPAATPWHPRGATPSSPASGRTAGAVAGGSEPSAPALEQTADAVAAALASPEAQEILAAFTDGAPRLRLAWASGGHRRGLTWRVAALVAARCPGLRNDPTDSTWEALIREGRRGVEVELSPRHLPDERFAYRKGEVPAASHPTLAAALARVGGAEPADVVWDPFVGSGLELAERALLGPYRALHGTDLDERALDTARANLAAAGAGDARLVRADACEHDPGGVTLILTNPPMGRRVHRDGSIGDLLDRFVDHAARVLLPGGRLCWLSPLPGRTAERLRRAGLELSVIADVDMGGFTAQLQLARRR